jgi:transposase InsO family protein
VSFQAAPTRERTGWGPRLIAGETGVAHSTVHAILRRHGCSRMPRPARREVCRYEWPCPGDLLHIDVKRYPRFLRPGHAVTGDRTRTHAEKVARLGHDYFHAVVDDHTRLAYGELLADEKAPTVTAFVERALAWFAGHGISTRRVMTDGAWSYTRNRALRELFARREIGHIVTPPYTPRWNGKVERFHQTMEREWAKGLRYRNHHARNQALPHWLAHYNERRPHTALGGRSPLSRAHNLSGQDN